MDKRYILAIDEGTTSARAAVFDVLTNEFLSCVSKEFTQIYPQPGWVEHDPIEILAAQLSALSEAIILSKIDLDEAYGLGVTNQRETALMWDSKTGKPVYNAIVWQCRRTSEYCEKLIADGYEEMIKAKTGLKIDAYFSASKLKWILDNSKTAKQLLAEGRLMAGTIDSYLIYKLTNGKCHVTDATNASRTMLYNINTMSWDSELLELFGIPESILPKVVLNDEIVGETKLLGKSVKICGIAGDQQAALFGQMCFREGMAKNTYGTGCFTLLNAGGKPPLYCTKMLATVAWQLSGGVTYALEGSVFNAGSTIKWLRDEMNLISSTKESEEFALMVEDTLGVYFVPAFTGLGSPHWDMDARGMIIGLTRGANKYHVVRAALESMAYNTMDIFVDMQRSEKINLKELRCDGGASNNSFLMQFQADILNVDISRPKNTESTILGAIYMCGLGTGAFESLGDIEKLWKADRIFKPQMDRNVAMDKYLGWCKAVGRCKNWC